MGASSTGDRTPLTGSREDRGGLTPPWHPPPAQRWAKARSCPCPLPLRVPVSPGGGCQPCLCSVSGCGGAAPRPSIARLGQRRGRGGSQRGAEPHPALRRHGPARRSRPGCPAAVGRSQRAQPRCRAHRGLLHPWAPVEPVAGTELPGTEPCLLSYLRAGEARAQAGTARPRLGGAAVGTGTLLRGGWGPLAVAVPVPCWCHRWAPRGHAQPRPSTGRGCGTNAGCIFSLC